MSPDTWNSLLVSPSKHSLNSHHSMPVHACAAAAGKLMQGRKLMQGSQQRPSALCGRLCCLQLPSNTHLLAPKGRDHSPSLHRGVHGWAVGSREGQPGRSTQRQSMHAVRGHAVGGQAEGAAQGLEGGPGQGHHAGWGILPHRAPHVLPVNCSSLQMQEQQD